MSIFGFIKNKIIKEKQEKPQGPQGPVMYIFSALNGNVILNLPMEITWRLFGTLKAEAEAELRKDAAFEQQFSLFSAKAEKEYKEIKPTLQNPNIDIINDPIRLLSKKTGISLKKLEEMNGVHLFMYKVDYTISPYGQPFPVQCSTLFFFMEGK